MAFKTAFIAHTPDAEPDKHRCSIKTSIYELYVLLVKNQEQAVEECKKLKKEKGIHSVLLCPGFTHSDIAELFDAMNREVAVSVARGDGPSSRIAMDVMQKEGWFDV